MTLKMFVNTKGVIFVIYTFFVILVDSISPGTFVVSNCPKNQHEVIKASRRLQCVNDKNGNNQYLCLPMKEKTSLVEFCFDADMKIEEKGYCLEIFEGKLIQHSCLNFSYGCPEEKFWLHEFYKYPACQNINTKLKCYVSDPLCADHPSLDIANIVYASLILGGSVFFFVVCFLLCKKCKRNHRNRGRRNFIQTRYFPSASVSPGNLRPISSRVRISPPQAPPPPPSNTRHFEGFARQLANFDQINKY